MASKRRSGMDRWLVGSRAEQVLRLASVPVLLVLGASRQLDEVQPWTLRIIVAVLDGSGADAATLKEARRLTAAGGVTVVLTTIDVGIQQPRTGWTFWQRGQSRDVGVSAAESRAYRAWKLVAGARGLRRRHVEGASVDALVRASEKRPIS